MKPWMRILMWFGLGVGVGFFAGQQTGYNKAKKEDETFVNEAYTRGQNDAYHKNDIAARISRREELSADAVDAMTYAMMTYAGDEEADKVLDEGGVDPIGEDEEWLEEPVMPEDSADADTVDSYIPQMHPTHMAPELVTEEEYDQRQDLDEERLLYFEGDEVLYNSRTNTILTDEDIPNAIGYGYLTEFRAGVGEPKDAIYIINEVLGTRFRIERMDGAFCDAVDGTMPPDDDDVEIEDDDE